MRQYSFQVSKILRVSASIGRRVEDGVEVDDFGAGLSHAHRDGETTIISDEVRLWDPSALCGIPTLYVDIDSPVKRHQDCFLHAAP